jgi:hypothetical protein
MEAALWMLGFLMALGLLRCWLEPRPRRRNWGLSNPPHYKVTTEQKRRRPW